MPSFDYTVDLERDLLKIVTASPTMCRMYLHQLKDEWFSSGERKFILAVAQDTFHDARANLSRKIYEYEVGSKLDDAERSHFIGEWNLIEAVETQEHPEILMAKLREAAVGRQILETEQQLITFLEEGRIADAVAHLKQAAVQISINKEVRPIVELTEYQARKQLILDKRAHPEKYLGIKTGFKTFDERTGGLFSGELTLIAGITGIGKSTLMKQIERGIVTLNPQKNVLHIANEEYQEQVQHKFDAGFTGIPYLDFKLAKITDTDLERWEQMMQHWPYGRVFLQEVPAFTDVTLVERAYQELASKGVPIHVIVIDHLPNVKPIEQVWGENDELKKAAADCKELARALKLPLVVPTQAATIIAEKTEKGKRAGQLDVFGSRGQVHVANTFMIIMEQGSDETQTDRQDWERDVFWSCDVKKNRDGARFRYRAIHRVRTGIIEEVPEEQSAQTKVETQTAAAAALAETVAETVPSNSVEPEVEAALQEVAAESVPEDDRKEQLFSDMKIEDRPIIHPPIVIPEPQPNGLLARIRAAKINLGG